MGKGRGRKGNRKGGKRGEGKGGGVRRRRGKEGEGEGKILETVPLTGKLNTPLVTSALHFLRYRPNPCY
jgi:hypothetical protein